MAAIARRCAVIFVVGVALCALLTQLGIAYVLAIVVVVRRRRRSAPPGGVH
jgi:hypothetical protein